MFGAPSIVPEVGAKDWDAYPGSIVVACMNDSKLLLESPWKSDGDGSLL